jgi:hypothetical protein
MAMHAPAQEQREFERPKPGAHQAVCVDVVDLGLKRVEYKGQPKLKHKIQFRFQIDQRLTEGDFAGQPFIVNQRMTWSLFQSAALKPWLESWLGRKLSESECDYHHPDYFDFESLLGRNAMLTLAEETKNGRTYTNIISIMPWDDRFGDEIQGESYVRICKRPGYQGPINDTLTPQSDDDDQDGYQTTQQPAKAATTPPLQPQTQPQQSVDTGDDPGNGPILLATRSAIIEQAKIFWGADHAAPKLKEHLSPKSLNSLSEGVAQSVLKDLKQKTAAAMNPRSAARAKPDPIYPEDDFDDSDPFADTP